MSVPDFLDYWGPEYFEPLMIAFVFHILANRTWELRGTPKSFAVARKLCVVFQKTDLDAGYFLCRFLLEIRRVSSYSRRCGVVHVILQAKT